MEGNTAMLLRQVTLFVLVLASTSAWATFGAKTAWDVHTVTNSGADTNGGGFDLGVVSPGTDESIGAGLAITITLTGTTSGTGSLTFSATTHGPGNFVHIASGTGCTVGWYEIVSQSVGTATFDHAMGSIGNSCVGIIGGSLLTISQATALAVANNTVYVQSGTYNITSQIAIPVVLTIQGYATTHSDFGTAPLISTSTNNVIMFHMTTGNGTAGTFNNLNLTSTAVTPGDGIRGSNSSTTPGITVNGVNLSGFHNGINCNNGENGCYSLVISGSEIKNSTDVGVYAEATPLLVSGCYVHNNASNGIHHASGGGSVTIVNSIVASNTGAGIYYTGTMYGVQLLNNSIYGNGNSGFNSNSVTTTGFTSFAIQNTAFYGNTGYGINLSAVTLTNPYSAELRNNAYGANTTAPTNGIVEVNPVITLTANPFTSTTDFSLNTTAGGGALLKATGYPGITAGGIGYLSIGAIQPTPISGGGVTVTNAGYAN